MKQFKSYNLEEIVNIQEQKLKPALLNFIANTSNNRTIDYTHTIDISFEERRHEVLKRLKYIRHSNIVNFQEVKRLERIINRLSHVNYIEYDLRAFTRRMKRKIDFDAFYLIP